MVAAEKNTHESTWLERIALRSCAWAERWIPDGHVFAALAVVGVAIAALALGTPLATTATNFGTGFWNLIPFTMQMCLIIISGHAVASSPPIARFIDCLAGLPRTGRGAVCFVALIGMLTSLVHWGLSMILASLLVRALARREDLDMDYRAAAAASYVSIGSVFAMGLSSSAAQLQANPQSLPPKLLDITGVLPFQETIFLWQSTVTTAVMIAAALAVAWLTAPRGARATTAQALGIPDQPTPVRAAGSRRPGEWLEYSPLLSVAIAALGFCWLWLEFNEKGWILAISNLNTYNFLFLMVGMLLCWRPRVFLDAVARSGASLPGVMIQFPLYAGIAALIQTPTGQDGNGVSIAEHMANFFTASATHDTFPVIIGLYSVTLGFLVPSAGGKWVIEAPYVMQSANDLQVHLGWVVQTYNAAETLPNLINPFWMLPGLSILQLKPRDIIGFTIIQFAVLLPLVLFLLWIFGTTLEYHPPRLP